MNKQSSNYSRSDSKVNNEIKKIINKEELAPYIQLDINNSKKHHSNSNSNSNKKSLNSSLRNKQPKLPKFQN